MNASMWAIVAIVLSTIIVGAVHLPEINAWERANNYPFGKLCELYRNCARVTP